MKTYPLPELYKIIKGYCKLSNTSLNRLSIKMGYSRTFLSVRLKTNDVRCSLLLALSEELKVNLFDHYENLLPEALRNTSREVALKRQLMELEIELMKVKEERDRYWEVIGKR